MSGEAYALAAVLFVLAVMFAAVAIAAYKTGVAGAEASRATDQAKEVISHARDVEQFAEDMGDVEALAADYEAKIRALPHGPDRAALVSKLLTLRLRAATRKGPPAAPGDRPPDLDHRDPLA